MGSKNIRWLPLESNPDVVNKYVQTLGVPVDKWQYFDVIGTDPELLQMVPKPVIAVLLLFPITDTVVKGEKEEQDRIKEKGQNLSNKLWFMKQTIGNACGTIGVIHSLANNQDRISLAQGPLKEFFDQTASMDPALKATALEKADKLAEVHEENAKEGQTQAPSLEDDTNLHFVAFVEKEGQLYQLDGRKPYPINHGPVDSDTLLEDAVKVIQKDFIERDPDQVNFSMLALASAM
eukprot:TRINITY_DN5410_c0_g1_i1.p1 TRINITY_DN5410_c0_g1~~TRINITY_DN5410_c0_g1_i1.p1  ORF type:complete len:258 (-),score=34.26 TRINITY_DN5410_c0_g1_i1:28-732(-)